MINGNTYAQWFESLTVHPMAEKFPPMSPDEFVSLKNSIAEQGMFHLIVVDHKNRIVDGRNRWNAAKEVGLHRKESLKNGLHWDLWEECKLPEGRKEATEEEIEKYIYSENCDRRNLTQGQKAIIGIDFMHEFEGVVLEAIKKSRKLAGETRTKKHQGLEVHNITNFTKRDFSSSDAIHFQLARMTGVGAVTAMQAIHVSRRATDLVPDVRSGKMTISKAYNILRDREDPSRVEKREKKKAIPPVTIPKPNERDEEYSKILTDKDFILKDNDLKRKSSEIYHTMNKFDPSSIFFLTELNRIEQLINEMRKRRDEYYKNLNTEKAKPQ